MAKLLLSCDDYIFRHQGRYYYKNKEWFDFYQRYLRIFEQLRIVNRCIEETILKKERVLVNDPRIEIVPIPIFHGPKQYLKVYFRIGKILRHITQSCDVAILRLPSTVAQRVCKKVIESGIPYATEIVYDAHADVVASSNLFERILFTTIDNNVTSLCYTSDGISCVTEHFLQQRYYSKKQRSFTSSYSSLSLDKSFYGHERQFPVHSPLVITHVANQVDFNGRKGQKELMQTVKLLKEQAIFVKVKFAGDNYNDGIPKLKHFAKELGISDQVEFVGFLSRVELDCFLTTSDLFVLPTKAEGLPRVLIEAMAKGLPCVSSNVSGIPELLSTQYLVDFSDIQGIAEIIKKLVTSKNEYQSASLANFVKSKQFEASILEKRRDTFYSKLKELSTSKN